MALAKALSFKGDVSTGGLAVLDMRMARAQAVELLAGTTKYYRSSGASAHQEETQCEQTLNKKIA